jgi:peptide/nickel transport system substrate-binding protein
MAKLSKQYFAADKVLSFRQKRTACFLVLLLVSASPAIAAPGDCGTVIIPVDNNIDGFNPMMTSTFAGDTAAGLMYMGLIWVNRFQQIDWSRSLASAIKTPDAGLTFQVTLRPWHWSDGTPVTTTDIAYSLKLLQDWDFSNAGGMPGIVKTFTARDATHFDLVLTHRVNPLWFIFNGLSALSPMPAHDWRRFSNDQLWQKQTTPTFFKTVDGPMMLGRLDVGQDAVMVPNPEYPGPKPHFRQLILNFMHSDGSGVQMVETGEMDIAPLPMTLLKTARNLPGVHMEFLAPRATYYHMFLNFRNPDVAFFRELDVRKAIEDALDRDGMNRLLFQSYGTPILAPLDPSEAQFLAPSLRAGHYPAGYDPPHAAALLRHAGYVPGRDGIVQKNARRLSFTALIPSGSNESLMMAEMIVEQLRAVGIEMKLRQYDATQVIARVYGGGADWQAAYLYTIGGGYPSGELDFATDGARNAGGYSDPEMDRLINASITQPGVEGLYDYEAYASAQVPAIFAIAPPNVVLVRNRLHGVNDFYDPAGQLAPEQLTCTDSN